MNWQKQDKAELEQSAPDVVVQDYLDFMLRSATLAVETVPLTSLEDEAKVAVIAPSPIVAVPEIIAPPKIAASVQQAVPELKAPTVSAPVVAPVKMPEMAVEVVTPVVSQVTTPSTNEEPPKTSNGRPYWANESFECLLFQVLGLKLGAALVELGGIARVTEDLTPIFGQSEWFMGLLRWNERNIKVIDTARLIMPERLQDLAPSEHPKYEFVLLIEGTDWGLGIDSATESVSLHPDEVRWRVSKQTRPWLAGTALERMCALLDMKTVSSQLTDNERPN